MNGGELLTRGTALLMVACYLIRVLLDVGGGSSIRTRRWTRGIWTLGCGLLWLHIAMAYHFIHNWSHAEAVRQTAEQTGELTGWFWGGGVCINYALALFWLMDVLIWWRRDLDDPYPSPTSYWITHAIFGFLMFNATIIFGPDYWKGIGLLVFGALITIAIHQRSKR